MMALKSLKEKLGIGDDPKPLAALYFIQEKLLIHPGKGKTYDFKHILKTQIIYLFVLGLTFNGGIIGHFLMSSSDIMFTERFESAFNIIISSLQLGYTLIHMILGNEFMRLLKRIDSAKFGRPKKLLVEYRLFNIFCVAFTFVIGVFVVLYSSFHYFHNDFCNGRTILKDKRFVCGLTAPAWYPFEIEDGIQTNILLFWSFLYLFLVEPSSSFFIFGDIELTKLVQIKMMDLRYQIDQIEDVQSKEFKKKFKFFVAYYTEILGCIRDLNNTMGYCMMAATSLATLSLALMEFNILISENYGEVIIFVVVLTVVATIATITQMLEDEHEALIQSVCSLPWYDMQLSVKKEYPIFVAMVQMPIHLRARFIADVNNKLLYSVIKGTYSLLMYMLNTTKPK